MKRFFRELDLYPCSVRAQNAECLRRYIKAVGDPGLIVGDEPEFQDLLNIEIEEHDLEVFFSRKK